MEKEGEVLKLREIIRKFLRDSELIKGKKIREIEDLIWLDEKGYFHYCLDGRVGICKVKYSKVRREVERFMSFLNEECEIREGKRYYPYLKEVREFSDEIIQLKSNPKIRIEEYESGKKCLFDAAMDFIQISGLCDYAEVFRMNVNPLRPKLIKRLILAPFLAPYGKIDSFLLKKGLVYLSKRMLGQYDANVLLSPFITPVAIQGKIRVVSSNIRNVAEESKCEVEDVERYVITHEEIHDRQTFNFPEIEIERRRLAKRLLLAYMISEYGGIKEVPASKAKAIKNDAMERLKVLSCVLEGHADFFSKKIGEKMTPNFSLKRKYNLLTRLKLKLYRLEEKMEEYELGFKFIKHLYEKGGAELANLPLKFYPLSGKELTNPDLYLKRASKILNP